MNSIFISYRRNDSADAAGRVYDRLRSLFMRPMFSLILIRQRNGR